ncbi:MAG: cupin domain-containing protein [Thermovirgaceae bacterium]|nr:cupin domain-containing protein [Synergistales bacterium]HPC76327.1 cupin domain-containing protein [Synergistales bacterium]HRS48887.1 cupin domain-containing protein [Thermovirgaceae bacterium]HRU91181.1 cupin domain-containing protein [Thermovirgaceae bacterium]
MEVVYTGKIEDLELFDASSLAPEVTKRVIFGPGKFWNDYTMRHFSLPAVTVIPDHLHDWPHYMIGLSGTGFVTIEGKAWEIPPMGWAHVPGGMVHGYENPGPEPFVFLCIVPTEGDPHMKLKRFRMERSKRKVSKRGQHTSTSQE